MTAQIRVSRSGDTWAAFLKCEDCKIGAIYSPMDSMEYALEVGDDMVMLHDLENHGAGA